MERPARIDAGGFRRFYEEEVTNILGYLIAVTGDRWVAEELAQETFVRAYRNWNEIRGYDNPGGWTHRVAYNLAMSRFRRLGAEARAMVRLRSMRQLETDVEPASHDERFWAEVRKLPDRQAQAVTLHYLEDRPVAEIAELMEVTESTAKVHLHRGRKRLADRLGLEIGDGGER